MRVENERGWRNGEGFHTARFPSDEGSRVGELERRSIRLGLRRWTHELGPGWLRRLALVAVLAASVGAVLAFRSGFLGVAVLVIAVGSGSAIFLIARAFKLWAVGIANLPYLQAERRYARQDRRYAVLERLIGELRGGGALSGDFVLYLRPFDADVSLDLELSATDGSGRQEVLHLEDFLADLMAPWGDLVVFAPPKSAESSRLPRFEERAVSHLEAPGDCWFDWFSRLASAASCVVFLPLATSTVRKGHGGPLPRGLAEALRSNPVNLALAEGMMSHLLEKDGRQSFRGSPEYDGTASELRWLIENQLCRKTILVLPPTSIPELRDEVLRWLGKGGVIWPGDTFWIGSENGEMTLGRLNVHGSVISVETCELPSPNGEPEEWQDARAAMRKLLHRPGIRRRLLAGLESASPRFT